MSKKNRNRKKKEIISSENENPFAALSKKMGFKPAPTKKKVSEQKYSDLNSILKTGEIYFDRGAKVDFNKKSYDIESSSPYCITGQKILFEANSFFNKKENGKEFKAINTNIDFKPTDNRAIYNDIDNFNLKINKYSRFFIDDNKFNFYKKNRDGEELINMGEDFNFSGIETISKNYKKSIQKTGYEITSQIFNPDYRFIVGLGGKSVYETSITLHHIYGFPYIPGQAVKGVLSSWFVKNEFEKFCDLEENTNVDYEQILCFEKMLCNYDLSTEENKRQNFSCKIKKNNKERKIEVEENLYFYLEQNKHLISLFQTVFGTQQQKGKFIFFDVYPTKSPKLKNDIMTPHYGPYYSEKKTPGDYYSPIPIPFLTVENTPFEFIFGYNKKYKEVFSKIDGINTPIEEEVSSWMKKALSENGIGSKTAVGYGYFE